jgi:uncharacterized membrane protein (UPF0127 family)
VKKIAYPFVYIDGQPDDDENTGIAQQTNRNDSLSMTGGRPESAGTAGGDETNPSIPQTYSGGMAMLIDEGTEDLTEEVISLSDDLADMMQEGSILSVGDRANKSKKLASERFGITILSDIAVSSREAKAYRGDIRFINFNTKFDGFLMANKFRSEDDFKSALENVHSQLSDGSLGVVSGKNKSLLASTGFEIVKSTNNLSLVKKSDSDPRTIARVITSAGTNIGFLCKTLVSMDEQAIGLQSYRALGNNSGLLFKYNHPSDVTYHMGTVGFPIDIVFIGEDDRVIKVSKDIQPGSLDLFSCSGVKTVLEVSGGISSKAGISPGDSVFLGSKLTASESTALRVAERQGLGAIMIKESESLDPIVKLGSCSLISVSKDTSNMDIYRLMTPMPEPKTAVSIFNIDRELLSSASTVRMFPKNPVGIDDESVFLDIDNNAFSGNKDKDYGQIISTAAAVNQGFWNLSGKNMTIAVGKGKSLERFLGSNAIVNKMGTALSRGERVVIATSIPNIDADVLSSIIHAKVKTDFPMLPQKSVVEIMRVPAGFTDDHIVLAGFQKYLTKDIKFNSLSKRAGVPVPNATKDRARSADQYFEKAEKLCVEISDDLEKNLSEYERVQGNDSLIANSKGQYNQSTKKISRKVKRMLIDLRDGIKVMNEIKDISTTSEIVHNLAGSSRLFSDSIKDIFSMIDKISTSTFVPELAAATSSSEKIGEDLKMTIERMRRYISSNILGVLVLSE